MTEERLKLQSQPVVDLKTKMLDTIDFLTDYKRIHRVAEEEKLTDQEAVAYAFKEGYLTSRLQSNNLFFERGNYRLVRNFNYLDWRLIERIIDGEVKIEQIENKKFQELLWLILPDGQTLATLLLKKGKLDCFIQLI